MAGDGTTGAPTGMAARWNTTTTHTSHTALLSEVATETLAITIISIAGLRVTTIPISITPADLQAAQGPVLAAHPSAFIPTLSAASIMAGGRGHILSRGR